MKSEGVTLENKRSHMIKVKGESEVGGQLLGLFDDDSYREERKLQRISSIADVVSTNFQLISLSLFVIFSFNLY